MEIVGTYSRVEGQPYHTFCFKCAHCGVPIKRDYYSGRGQFYCPSHPPK
jgi:formamidopyrimidine-DNA glycosylase